MALQTSIFKINSRLHKAIAIINSIEDAKFSLLITRIFQRLHTQNREIFSDEEELKLQSSLTISREDLQLVLDILKHILEQIIYALANPERVNKQLELIKLDETKRDAIIDAWTNRAKTIVNTFKQTSIEPKQLESAHWRLNLSMGQSSRAKLKQPIAQFDLGISSKSSDGVDHLFLDFDHEELFDLYSQLEQIQSQLDYLR